MISNGKEIDLTGAEMAEVLFPGNTDLQVRLWDKSAEEIFHIMKTTKGTRELLQQSRNIYPDLQPNIDQVLNALD